MDEDSIDKALALMDALPQESVDELLSKELTVVGLGARRSGNFEPIEYRAGELDILTMKTEKVLIEGKYPIFDRGGVLVQPVMREVFASRKRKTIAASFNLMSPTALDLYITHAVSWVKFDKRSDSFREIDVPGCIAKSLIDRGGRWRFPVVSGIITCPTLRPDGSIIRDSGLDESTRLFHAADPSLKLPKIPDAPTKEQAAACLHSLRNLLVEFPFKDRIKNKDDAPAVAYDKAQVDESVALSGIISPIVRGALPAVPMHAMRAPYAGSGKSFLIDIISILVTGRPCPVIAVTEKEEENEKRLAGMLLAGFPIINLDNCNGELGGDLLCQAIERPAVSLRPLGASTIIEIENSSMIYATGNSLRVREDMTRRTLLCNLDPETENPENREFLGDPVGMIVQNRGRYVADCITIVRAYIAAGMPDKPTRLASFGEWSDLVRGALIWLGCVDPAKSLEEAKNDDPERAKLDILLQSWALALKEEMFASGELIAKSEERFGSNQSFSLLRPDLREAIAAVAALPNGSISPIRLGRYLEKVKNKQCGGLVLRMPEKKNNGANQWKVEKINKKQSPA